MITFERTTNRILVSLFHMHPAIYRYLTDDSAGPRESFEPVMDPRVYHVVVKDSGEPFALFTFVPHNGVTYEGHIAILPVSGRPRSSAFARDVMRWMFEHSPCRRIVAAIPAYNRLAVAFALEACGLSFVGIDRKSFQKFGSLHDRVLLGLSPEDL